MKKIFLFLATVLLVGFTAQAMLTAPVSFQGQKRTVNNTSYCSWQFHSVWGEASLPTRQGTSYTFSNTNLGWSPVDVTVNGTLNFQESTTLTDVVASGTFTVTFYSSSIWFYSAKVKSGSGTVITGCDITVSYDRHTVIINIPSGGTFGQIVLDYVPNEPLSDSNTVIGGIDDSYTYKGSAIEPVPTVTYYGATLTAGTDYTVSYSGSNSVGTATVTVTGTGNYYGTVTKNYYIHNITLSDFRRLDFFTYEIATMTDLDNLALLVNVAANSCIGVTFKQTADIAYSTTGLSNTGENFTTIGGYFNGDKSFSGTYDGQGHTISGIRLNKPSTNQNANKNQAFFGRTVDATIMDVTLTDARIAGYRIVGGIVGYCENSTVQNCLVLNSAITCGDTYVGALIGRNQSSNKFTANYYHNCTVNGTAGATGVGVGGNGVGISYSSDCDGARSVHALTLPDGVTATGESVTIDGVTYYASNTTVTLAYNTNAGYNTIYSVNGNAITGSTFTMPAADATVTVTTTVVNYSITYDLAGGALPAGQSNPTSYNVETPTFTLINPIRDGYTFAGWTGSNGTTPQSTVTIPSGSTGNRSYTAKWTPISYTITYKLVGGVLPYGQSNPTTYNIETGTFTLINPGRNGYRFDGWTGSNGTTPQTTVTIPTGSTGDLNYTANWTERYTYDSTTGALTLNWGEYNKDDKWDDEVTASAVKSVTATSAVSFTGDCSRLFYYFNNCKSMDLNNVNTSEMMNAVGMFSRCSKLTSLDLSGWNTANVVDMCNMFSYCSDLISLDLSGWNTANVTDMSWMFEACRGLTSLDLSGWNTANVVSMYRMFEKCSNMTTLDVSGWNTGNVTDMSYMFWDCTGLDSLNLSGWNTGNVTNMNRIFQNCSGLTSLDVSGWNTGNVTSMGYMFYDCSGLDSLDLSGWNTANVTNMSFMFSSCSSLTSLNASGWNTANVTSMSNMFNGCYSLDSLDLSGWNTTNVTNMGYMFSGCSGLTSLDVSGWNTANVTNMSYMFSRCSGLTSLDLSGWNTAKVTDMGGMFYNCSGLTTLDVSGWNTANVTNMSYMFKGCSELTTIYAGEDWSTEKVTSSGSMFSDCSNLVGGMGTTYDESHVNKAYAHIDGGLDNPGYFTGKTTAQRGDVNNDGNIDVDDVTTLIAAVLGNTTVDSTVADVNNDNSVDIDDVTALIGRVLNGTWE